MCVADCFFAFKLQKERVASIILVVAEERWALPEGDYDDMNISGPAAHAPGSSERWREGDQCWDGTCVSLATCDLGHFRFSLLARH